MTPEQQFEALRSLLFAIAYRILGSVSEAEDAVQATWLRYATTQTQPRSLRSFLSATVSRIAIDVLRSARVRREQYVGPWVPEPLLTDPYEDPERAAELSDSVSMTALLLLERLSPLERAVFVLREVFGFDYAEVASTVGRSEAACRQLVVRARRHMRDGRPRFEADRQKRLELAERFFDALKDGDVDRLRDLLAADVLMVGDGGGGVRTGAASWAPRRRPGYACGPVPSFAGMGAVVESSEVNGQPGAILRDREGNVFSTWTLDIADGLVQTIRSVNNPDKLRHLGPVVRLQAVVDERNRARRSSK